MACDRTNWRVVYLMGVCSLIQNTQYSIYMTTMYAYMSKMDPSANVTHFGWILSTSSLGHCVGCYVLGWWNNRTKKSAAPMHCGLLLMLAANLLYLLIDVVPSTWVVPLMMTSRLLGGLGMGNSSPMRNCATMHSTPADRSKAMASISGGRSVGSVAGPGLQLMFMPLGQTGVVLVPGVLAIHTNNAPAFLGCLLTMIGFISLLALLREEFEEEMDQMAIADYENQFNTVREEWPSADRLAMFICMLTRFVQNFMQISMDSLFPTLLMLFYLVTKEETVGPMANLGLVTGLFATAVYFLIIFTDFSKVIKRKIFNSIVLLIFVAHLLATYPWPFYTGTVEHCQESWCTTLTITPIWTIYICSVLSFGVFLPFLNVANATLYSKLLNPECQGTQQSLYDISNTTARIFAPAIIPEIYQHFGPRRVWEFLCVMLLATFALWIVFDKRLVPLKPLNKQVFDNDAFEANEKTSKEKLVAA